MYGRLQYGGEHAIVDPSVLQMATSGAFAHLQKEQARCCGSVYNHATFLKRKTKIGNYFRPWLKKRRDCG